MPCTSCMIDYSRKNKEFGCSKCKFSFCRKCLPYEVVISSISAQPVPVCSGCYASINQHSELLSKNKNREMSSDMTLWSGEGLPPPSLRPLFSKQSKQPINKNEWNELENRLQRLNEPFEGKDEKKEKIQGIKELEERLAALRGVDVDIIRRPGLLVVNQNDKSQADDLYFENEAKKLLDKAKHSLQVDHKFSLISSANNDSKNNLKINDSNQDCSSINSSVINETIDKITKSKKSENSSSSSSSSLEQQNLYPNLEECIRKTLEDATAAENEAIAFINSHQQINKKDDENIDNNNNGTNQQKQQPKNINLQKFYKFFKKPSFR